MEASGARRRVVGLPQWVIRFYLVWYGIICLDYAICACVLYSSVHEVL